MGRLVASCVWDATPELIVTLDERFGESTDAYVNGSQVWLRDDGPGGVALALAMGVPPAAAPESLWEGLEAFAAYGDELEPAPLGQAAAASLGIAPRAVGLVDHERIGDAWERNPGEVSIVALLLEQLEG